MRAAYCHVRWAPILDHAYKERAGLGTENFLREFTEHQKFPEEEAMRRALIAATFALATGGLALAQDPAPKPDANAEHPPTNRMDQATPQMKAPAEAEHAPTNRVDQAVPPMKPGDPQSADTGTKSFAPTDEWIGRAVYSSDGKNLGDVAKLSGNDVLVDIGGFLGIGATRALIKADQIKEVQNDRIVLTLPEAEAKKLPAAEQETPATTPPQ